MPVLVFKAFLTIDFHFLWTFILNFFRAFIFTNIFSYIFFFALTFNRSIIFIITSNILSLPFHNFIFNFLYNIDIPINIIFINILIFHILIPLSKNNHLIILSFLSLDPFF